MNIRHKRPALSLLVFLVASCASAPPVHIVDVHLHGARDAVAQIDALRGAGVTAVMVSTSWDNQQKYVEGESLRVLRGLMFPCPMGKVPYSFQKCHADGREWPGADWTEAHIKSGHIDFFGEVLTQYYGISPSDPRMDAYYSLAVRYDLPVGMHTGSAGPDHGSPNFREDLGNPTLLREVLARHPRLRLWLMHTGVPFFEEAVALMRDYPHIYADISVMNNPEIVPPQAFAKMMRTLMEAGLGERIMFGSDNADVTTTLASLEALSFLSTAQKEAILHGNAERFFRMGQQATAMVGSTPTKE